MPSKLTIKIGRRFGHWIVLSETEALRYGRTQARRFLCRCDCGTEKAVFLLTLRKGGPISCGCVKTAAQILRQTKHGHAKDGAQSWTYVSWQAMITRCENPNVPEYRRYGHRGISVCARWKDFLNFVADIGERPPGTSIDRYPDRNGNYQPGNCRWATAKEQARNKDQNRRITYRGETKILAEWCEQYSISRKLAATRIYRGWDEIKAFTTPRRFFRVGHTVCHMDR